MTLRGDDVGHGDVREARAIRPAGARIARRGVGRAVARPQHVGAHDEAAIGIDRCARPDQRAPRALGRTRAGFDHAVSAGIAVRHQHRVAPVRREPAARA